MALPMNSTPTYKVEVPSTGEKINFRPFLVKEEKSLLIAQQSEDQEIMVETLKDVINSCTLGKINVEELALFDLEYLFTQIRGKSVGEEFELIFSCDTCVDEKAKVKINLDINNIKIIKSETHSKKIPLFGDVGVVMRYPNFNMIKRVGDLNSNDFSAVFNIVAECIDYIYDTDQVYYAKETKKEELVTFLENLTPDQFAKIQVFFETMPKLSTNVKYVCPVCSKIHDKNIEGLNNFF